MGDDITGGGEVYYSPGELGEEQRQADAKRKEEKERKAAMNAAANKPVGENEAEESISAAVNRQDVEYHQQLAAQDAEKAAKAAREAELHPGFFTAVLETAKIGLGRGPEKEDPELEAAYRGAIKNGLDWAITIPSVLIPIAAGLAAGIAVGALGATIVSHMETGVYYVGNNGIPIPMEGVAALGTLVLAGAATVGVAEGVNRIEEKFAEVINKIRGRNDQPPKP